MDNGGGGAAPHPGGGGGGGKDAMVMVVNRDLSTSPAWMVQVASNHVEKVINLKNFRDGRPESGKKKCHSSVGESKRSWEDELSSKMIPS